MFYLYVKVIYGKTPTAYYWQNTGVTAYGNKPVNPDENHMWLDWFAEPNLSNL